MSTGAPTVNADIPMPCCLLPSSLIPRYPFQIRWISLNMPGQMGISLLSWMPLLPLMRAVYALSSDVSAGTGNSGFCRKASSFLSAITLSATVFLPSAGSSCGLKVLRIFYSYYYRKVVPRIQIRGFSCTASHRPL